MKLLSADEATARLVPTMSRVKGRMTAADAAAASGLAIEDARTGLEAMMNRYQCRLQVTESGEILFDFGSSLRRRGKKTGREIMADAAAVLWKVFKAVFKVWITVMLILYLVVFLLILLALMFANRDENRGVKPGKLLGVFADLFATAGRGMILIHATDSFGYQHKSYKQATRKDPAKAEKKKRLVQSVFDFVFGPPRPDFDPFGNEKEVLAWLREQKGILTTSEIIALAGWTMRQAEERMADYLTRFKGRADITDDGVLIGEFREVLASGGAEFEAGKVELFWNEYEGPYQVTGNSSGTDMILTIIAVFNLLFSGAVIWSSSLQASIGMLFGEGVVSAGAVAFLLGWFPFIFFALFLTVPLIRSMAVRAKEKQRLQRNKRRRILRAVFNHTGKEATLDQILQEANSHGATPLKQAEAERLLQEALVEMDGDTTLNEEGVTLYRFPRLEREAATAAKIRASGGVDMQLGGVLFDTA